MKSITNGWRIGIVLLFGVTPLGLAVNGDLQAPGWRGQPGTTRQHWRFDTDASPTAPEVVSNAAGSPQATIAPNALAAGWYDSYVDVYGTAQGFWDLGGTNLLAPSPGTVLLTIPNTVSAGATRYLWVQATVWIESSLFDSRRM